MSISFEITDRGVALNLRKLAPAIRGQLKKAYTRLAIIIQARIQQNKLQGQVLYHRSGKLSGSVRWSVEEEADAITAHIMAGGGIAPYGYVHEYGGTFTIPAHMSMSRLGNQFMVREHTATFPERSYVRSTVDEAQNDIEEAVRSAVEAAINETFS